MSRILNFNDSFSNETVPTIEGAVGFKSYVSEAAYVADLGAPGGGSTFYNTTLDVIEYYDASISDWVFVGQAGQVTGTRGAPIAITASGITVGGFQIETIYVEGSGGAVDITANPQISVGNKDGDVLILIGTSDANTLQIDDNNGVESNGVMLLVNNSVIRYKWDGITWIETARRD